MLRMIILIITLSIGYVVAESNPYGFCSGDNSQLSSKTILMPTVESNGIMVKQVAKVQKNCNESE